MTLIGILGDDYYGGGGHGGHGGGHGGGHHGGHGGGYDDDYYGGGHGSHGSHGGGSINQASASAQTASGGGGHGGSFNGASANAGTSSLGGVSLDRFPTNILFTNSHLFIIYSTEEAQHRRPVPAHSTLATVSQAVSEDSEAQASTKPVPMQLRNLSKSLLMF